MDQQEPMTSVGYFGTFLYNEESHDAQATLQYVWRTDREEGESFEALKAGHAEQAQEFIVLYLDAQYEDPENRTLYPLEFPNEQAWIYGAVLSDLPESLLKAGDTLASIQAAFEQALAQYMDQQSAS